MSKIEFKPYIQPLISEHKNRGARSVLGLLGIVNQPLRNLLSKRLSGEPGSSGALLADPVFEPTFGWTESNVTFSSLKGKSLNIRLVDAMVSPPKPLDTEYQFPEDRHPFTHQLKSWEILSQDRPKSLVVTSGTGSGKTECFMVPILNRLANQADIEGALVGVRALFIYPLNALIASQQSRLDAWTHGFDGDLRYCLYTGQLEQTAKNNTKGYDGQVIDRDRLRSSPPPMLITNATMLEYMLVRKDDAPILEQSKGKLEWIVLDEAHTYVGSQAAEMALLLRRAMIAFDVDPNNVRFIATSATFGQDAETSEKLQRFLADMAGVDPEQVEVVYGERHVPSMPIVKSNTLDLSTLMQIEPDAETSDARYLSLAGNQSALQLRNSFLDGHGGCHPQLLSALVSRISIEESSRHQVLNWLDLLSGTRDSLGTPFLPLRIHLFHNVLSSIAACANSSCSERTSDLVDQNEWSFGAIYTDGSTQCKCGAPVLPLFQCTDSGEPFLKAQLSNKSELKAPTEQDEDEFALNIDTPDADEDSDETKNELGIRHELLICNTKFSASVELTWLELPSKKVVDKTSIDSASPLMIFSPSEDIACPCCAGKNKTKQFRRLGVGAPFTLSTVISTLLEFCPDDKEPNGKPFRGRKMISFTDSRQGTARTAVKIQQDSERAKARSFIYHSLLSSKKITILSPEDNEDLAHFRTQKKSGPLNPRDARSLLRIEAQLGSTSQPKISWTDLCQKLSMDRAIQDEILDYYRRHFPNIFSGTLGPKKLAEIMLQREFGRRPKHQNSLESMGLVSVIYPQLDNIKKAPEDWPDSDLASWKDYLKVLLDFYVRENSFISIPPENLKLLGSRLRPKLFMPPTSREQGNNFLKKWPQASEGERQSRPIALLLHAFEWDITGKRQCINRILTEAWSALTSAGLLQKPGSDGFSLDLNNIELQLIETAGLCPVTRRFLDTSFMRTSPYINHIRAKESQIVEYKIPIYHTAFGGDKDPSFALSDARSWLENQPEVLNLRELGLWSDLHDRIIEGAHYFRTAEHSAQQSQKRLQEYERLFKSGKVNLLSCSTTMEMGVDIGGITIVAMNNVPPHPANYLQRAGRAGRRSELRSVAMTVCKQTPHDQSVFKDPMWPFETKISVPSVALRSNDLVQRHVNAYLLSTWMKNHLNSSEALKLKCGTFFSKTGEYSFAERFGIWCKSRAKEINLHPELGENLLRLLKNTSFSFANLQGLILDADAQLIKIQSNWKLQHEILMEQKNLVFAGAKESTPALKALSIQLKRLEDEYLLGELAENHFLPGYGFPTGIVTFDNLSISSLQSASASSTQGREDNRGRFRQLPSRDRATGLREYAPGAELVIDGLVYKSAGITLNWHAPASENALKEAQLFKYAWLCKECGAANSSIGSRPEICDCCGSPLELDRIKEYLVPSGFAVDFYADPHNDISASTYVPVQQPWLSLSTDWMPLVNPNHGMFRFSPEAHVFHYTSGQNKSGFAICLECGKTEPMLGAPDQKANLNEQYLPPVFRVNHSHKRLRGGKRNDGNNICPGSDNPWKIKQGSHLGHDASTNAIEIILRDPATGLALHNDSIAYSLSVAIRSAFANQLCIQEEELGCTSRDQKVNNEVVSVIQIFDARSGGYCSQAYELLMTADFWQQVSQELSCKENCAAACQHCLLSYDTRFSFDKLNRHEALFFLTQDWIKSYSLPENLKAFGDGSMAETLGIYEALGCAISKSTSERIRIYLHGSPAEWDLPSAHRLHSIIVDCLARSINIELVSIEGSIEKLNEAERYKLASYIDLGIQYGEVLASEMYLGTQNVPLIAFCQAKNISTGWANTDVQYATPTGQWGAPTSNEPYIKGALLSKVTLPAWIKGSDLRPKTGDVEVDIFKEIDGPINSFGTRFWDFLFEKNSLLKEKLTNNLDEISSIEYTDRYLKNPLSIGIFINSVYQLKSLNLGSSGFFKLKVHTAKIKENSTEVRKIFHCGDDWTLTKERDQVLEGVINYCGFDATINIDENNLVMHGRVLTINFKSGDVVRIRLDQGFSYWRLSSKPSSFPFGTNIDEQIDRVVNLSNHITTRGEMPTQIFIKINKK